MSYNGWRDWETWNVALWLYNTEALYEDVCVSIRKHPNVHEAASHLYFDLGYDGAKTHDGAEFTYMRVLEAIKDDHEEYWEEFDGKSWADEG